MKPIIVDMKDLSDSVEVYESKPNPFLIYTIYAIMAALIAAVIWSLVFHLDDVVKSDGIFKGDDDIYDISSDVSGKITTAEIKNGDYVNEGDVLYVVSIDSLSDTIELYQNNLKDASERLEMLSVYEDALDNDTYISTEYSGNKYYDEFVNREKLLRENINSQSVNVDGQSDIYQGNINSITNTIKQYEEKIEKLKQVKENVISRNNAFSSKDSYYYSIVNSYISLYSNTSLQYDNKIAEYQNQISLLEKQLEDANNAADAENRAAQRYMSLENGLYQDYYREDGVKSQADTGNIEEQEDSDITEESAEEEPVNTEGQQASMEDFQSTVAGQDNDTNKTVIENLESQIEVLNSSINMAETEKKQALSELQESQLASVEQLIENCKENLLSLNSNLTGIRLELNNTSDTSANSRIAILTEKSNISNERISYEQKKTECENYLKGYNIQNDNCTITAPSSGYYYCSQNLKQGSYIQEGGNIGSIYPETESKFYAELYVGNSDIGRIAEGQKVKFEISAFPSREYGYFSGEVVSIARDIVVDENSGYAYYIVKVECDEISIISKNGEKAALKNGMACQGKIIIGEKTVMQYILEKIHLIM